MDPIIKNADPEKIDRIIAAAVEEFARYPYLKASTNTIAKNAGVSKGLLFHYFGSKQALYDQVTGIVLNKLFGEITGQIDWDERDVLKRIKALMIVKIKIGHMYPNMFEFVLKVLAEKDAGSLARVKEMYENYGINLQSVLGEIYVKNIDFSLFRDPRTIDKSINIMQWTLEKLAEESLLLHNNGDRLDYEKISQEMDTYMNILKDMLYNRNKEEEQE